MESLLFKESKYQATKIGYLPHDWELKKLKDVADFWNGKAHEQAIDDNGDYIVINSKFISRDGTVVKHCSELISPLKKKDIAIVMSDIPNGKAIAKCFNVEKDNKYSLNQRIGGIRCVEALPEFLYYVLNRNPYFLKFDDGIQQTNLRKDDILNCPIQFPSINEQESIAEILKTIDKKIMLIDNKIKCTQVLKNGVMQKLFSEGVGIQNKNAKWEPHISFKKSIYGSVPVSWNEMSFKVLLNNKIISGIQDGNHGDIHPVSKDFVDEGMPFIMANSISKDNYLNVEKAKKISIEQYNGLRIGFSSPGDVLLTHKGTVGLTAVVKEEDGKVMLTPQVTYYRIANNKIIHNYFLYYFFQSFEFQKRLKVFSTQSTRAYIGITKQAEQFCLLPPVEEQKEISNILLTVDTKLRLLKKKKAETLILKKGLMRKLLTGEWRIKICNDVEDKVTIEA
jgi:type I restriction enzyme S subunit